MSSPAEASASQPAFASGNNENDLDMDEEMEDQTQVDATATAQNTSSATLDTDMTSTQRQNETGASGGSGGGSASTAQLHNRKDATLREFLSKMDDYAPIIPDAVMAHYLTLSGLPPPSPHDPTGVSTNTTPLPLARLLALATQKFIADLAADAYQFSRIRASNTASASNPLGATGVIPGQGGPAGTTGTGTGGGGGAAGKAGQNATSLGVQRSGYGGGGQGGSGQGRTVLTMEDLGMAVQEYGINLKRGEFYR